MANIEKFYTSESEIKKDFEDRVYDYEEAKGEILDKTKNQLT